MNASPVLVQYSYYRNGLRESVKRLSGDDYSDRGIETVYTYDTAYRIDTISHNRSGTPRAVYDLNWDAGSRLTSFSTTTDNVVNYTYDAANQLTAANYAKTEYTDLSFGYDSNGNRNTNGNTPGLGNRQVEDSAWTFTYDANGNLTKRTNKSDDTSIEYTYDLRDRLTAVTYKSDEGDVTKRVEYAYDALNRRISQKVDTDGDEDFDETNYYINRGVRANRDGAGDQVVLKLNEDGEVKSRILYGTAVDEILAEEIVTSPTEREVLWMLTDHQNSVRDIARVNSSGNAEIVNHIMYDAFGTKIAETDDAIAHMYGYTGREFDEHSDLQYNRERYYDSKIGRFISQDPIGFNGGDPNLYRMVGNHPTYASDANGLKELDTSIYSDESARILQSLGDINAPNYDQLWKLKESGGAQVHYFRENAGTGNSLKFNIELERKDGGTDTLVYKHNWGYFYNSFDMDGLRAGSTSESERRNDDYERRQRHNEFMDFHGKVMEAQVKGTALTAAIPAVQAHIAMIAAGEYFLGGALLAYETDQVVSVVRGEHSFGHQVVAGAINDENVGYTMGMAYDLGGGAGAIRAASKLTLAPGATTIFGSGFVPNIVKPNVPKGTAASISNLVSRGEFTGGVADLTAALRQVNGRGSKWLHRIADRFDAMPGMAHILDDAEFAAVASRFNVQNAAGFYRNGAIYLNRSRGNTILRDFVHEGTHALDFGVGGIFSKVGGKHYVKSIDAMTPLQVFKREIRAFRAERLLDGTPTHGGGRSLINFILKHYDAMEPW